VITFTQEQIEDIIWMYSVNYKSTYIAKKYSCSHKTILKLLRRNNIDTSKQHIYVLKSQHLYCKYCDTVKSFDEFHANTNSKFGKKTICRDCQIKVRKKYNNDIRNKEHIRIYERNRRKTDISYRLCRNLRSRIYFALSGRTKSASTKELLGCTIEKLKEHLQVTAISNGYKDFDIESYKGSEYHVDHIKPCSSFNLKDEDEQRKCFHYTNLQILTAKANLEKGSTTQALK